jgi:hypothetical protein
MALPAVTERVARGQCARDGQVRNSATFSAPVSLAWPNTS